MVLDEKWHIIALFGVLWQYASLSAGVLRLQRVTLCEITTRFGVKITHSDRPHSTAIRLLRLGRGVILSHMVHFLCQYSLNCKGVTLCEITPRFGVMITHSDRPHLRLFWHKFWLFLVSVSKYVRSLTTTPAPFLLKEILPESLLCWVTDTILSLAIGHVFGSYLYPNTGVTHHKPPGTGGKEYVVFR